MILDILITAFVFGVFFTVRSLIIKNKKRRKSFSHNAELENKAHIKVGDIGMFWGTGYEKTIKYIGIVEEIREYEGKTVFCGCLSCWSHFEPLPTELQNKLRQHLTN